MLDLLVTNARLVTEREVLRGSLGILDGRIQGLYLEGTPAPDAAEMLDAKGQYVLPGGIDDHVHFNDPGYTWREDFPHGSRAAAAGGITTVIDMPVQNEPTVDNADIFRAKEAYLDGRSYVDFGFWGSLIRTNRADLKGLAEEGALAFKSFLSYGGSDYTNLTISEARDRIALLKQYDAVAGFHCEDDAMVRDGEAKALADGCTTAADYAMARPVEAEEKAVADILQAVRETGGRAHICHVSHPRVAELIRQAKAEGLHVTAETCMHYLLFTGDDLVRHGGIFKCSPPLRDQVAADGLFAYLADGTLDTICSDHSPSRLDEKDTSGEKGMFGAWGGLSGVQTTLSALWDYAVNQRHASPTLIARVLAANPARIFGIDDRKGRLAPGLDADFVLLDPEQSWVVREDDLEYLNKFSAFVGTKGKGKPVATYLRGKAVYADGVCQGDPRGRLLRKARARI